MTKQEIADLLKQVKMFYPRFESVEKSPTGYQINPDIINGWFGRIGWMDFDKALRILDSYMRGENGGKVPGLQLWMNSGKMAQDAAKTTMTFDRKRSLVIWEPEGRKGKTYEIPVTWTGTAYEDSEGRLYAFAETEETHV